MPVISALLDLYHRVFPARSLRPYELICLEAWKHTLPVQSQAILEAQLGKAYYVQRQALGAKVVFYYPRRDDIPLFSDQRPDLHAATVLLRASGRFELQTMAARIFVHRGRFFSIEFPKRPDRYSEQHHMKGPTLEVARVETLQSL